MSECPDFLLAGPAFARLLGIGERQVRRLAAQGVLPRVGRKFDPFACVPKFIAYLRTGAGESADLAEARLKLTEAQRRDLEVRTRQRERKLLAVDDVSNCFESAMVIVGSQLDGTAGRMCGELATISDPAVIRQRLFNECRRIRNAAADQLDALADDAESREGASSAATEDA